MAVLLVLVSVGRIQDFVTARALPLGKLLVFVGFVALITRRDIRRRLSPFDTRQGKAFLLFIAAMIASVPFGLVGSESLKKLLEVAPTMVAVVVITVAAVSKIQHIRYLFRAFSASASLLGLALLAGRGVTLVGAQGIRASVSTMYDPNDLALLASVSLSFSIGLLSEAKWQWRLVGLVGAVLAPVIVVQTGSRGGFLALSFVLLALLISKRSRIPAALRVAIVVILGLSYFSLPASFTARMETLFSLNEDYNTTAETGRVAIWTRGLEYFAGRPVFGVGIGQFENAEGLWARQHGIEQGFKWSSAHSIYVQVAAELGLLGLAGLLGMLVPNVLRIRRPARRAIKVDDSAAQLGWTLAVATMTFMLGGTFLGVAYGPVTFFLCATGICLSQYSNDRGDVRASVSLSGGPSSTMSCT